jgi:hypothetical protein
VLVRASLGAARLVIDQRHGLKMGDLRITRWRFPSVDTPPVRLGLRPPASALGRLRNQAIGAAIDARCPRVNHDLRTRCAGSSAWADRRRACRLVPVAVPLPAADGALVRVSAQRLAPQVHFVGPLLPPVPAGFERAGRGGGSLLVRAAGRAA